MPPDAVLAVAFLRASVYFAPLRASLRATWAAVDWFFGMTYSSAGPGHAPDQLVRLPFTRRIEELGERAPEDLDLRIRSAWIRKRAVRGGTRLAGQDAIRRGGAGLGSRQDVPSNEVQRRQSVAVWRAGFLRALGIAEAGGVNSGAPPGPAPGQLSLSVRLPRTERCRQTKRACPRGLTCGNGSPLGNGVHTSGSTFGPPLKTTLQPTV